MSDTPILEITSLTKRFNAKEGNVVEGIDLTIKKGTVTALLGESGSGKTTLARLIAGLEVPNSGGIALQGQILANDSTFVEPQHRGIGLVFQDYALFPHMTVYDNIGYSLQNHNNRDTRIKEVLTVVGLEALKKRYPHQLSGGQQQRIALARALAPQPKLLLLDEPFSNLDTSLKRNLRTELFEIIRQSNVTAIFLTHDTQDAMAVSDDIVVLKDGKLIQKGNAKSLYETPKNAYIASLFGAIVKLEPEDLELFGYTAKPNTRYAIRESKFACNKTATYSLGAKILSSTYSGDYYLNRALLPNKKRITFTSYSELNGSVSLGFKANDVLIFKTTS